MLTKDEAEVYDRQIRLWGVNAQSQIRKSKVLMLGFGGVASEVAKILVLAGIDTLTIIDHSKESDESDLYSNLFCRPNKFEEKPQFKTYDVKNKLKRLNPLVKVNIINKKLENLEDFKGYNLVTLTSFMDIKQISSINETCRKINAKFYLVLDFGFFGFMFNDLGAEFKFSYEVFEDIGSQNTTRNSGQSADPISIIDDAPNSNSDGGEKLSSNDIDDDDDDDEDNSRPKKKLRLYSPVRQTAAKSTDEKTTKVENISFVTFEEMIDIISTKSKKSHKCTNHTSPVLFLTMAMLEFYSHHNHLPSHNDPSLEEELNKIMDHLSVGENVKRKLNGNWSKCISGSLSPICAVLGGVAGQDMIRALSNKDIPLINTFSFDGMSMAGVVEKVGFDCSKEKQSTPIVRDFIEIDDD